MGKKQSTLDKEAKPVRGWRIKYPTFSSTFHSAGTDWIYPAREQASPGDEVWREQPPKQRAERRNPVQMDGEKTGNIQHEVKRYIRMP